MSITHWQTKNQGKLSSTPMRGGPRSWRELRHHIRRATEVGGAEIPALDAKFREHLVPAPGPLLRGHGPDRRDLKLVENGHRWHVGSFTLSTARWGALVVKQLTQYRASPKEDAGPISTCPTDARSTPFGIRDKNNIA